MSITITLPEAQSKLPELVHKLAKGEERAITEGDQVVARIVGERLPARQRPGPGLCKGMITIVAGRRRSGLLVVHVIYSSVRSDKSSRRVVQVLTKKRLCKSINASMRSASPLGNVRISSYKSPGRVFG